MSNPSLKTMLNNNPTAAELGGKLRSGGHFLVYGVTGSPRALLLDALAGKLQGPILFVAASQREAESLLTDYEFFSGQRGYLYPARPVLAGEADAESHELELQRLQALEQVVKGTPCLVTAPASALLERLPPPEHLQGQRLTLRPGIHDPQRLTDALMAMGYLRTDQVEGPGQYSRRGDVIDIFPATAQDAYRLSWFDIELESIRILDLASQRSGQVIDALEIGPAAFPLLTEEVRKRVNSHLAQALTKVPPLFQGQLRQDQERFNHLGYWPGYRQYLQYMFSETVSLTDYFSQGLVAAAETHELLQLLELYQGELVDRQKSLLEKGKISPDLQPYIDVNHLIYRWQKVTTCHFSLLLRPPKYFQLREMLSIPFRQVPSFYGQNQLFLEELAAWQKRKATLVIVSSAPPGQIKEMLQERDIPVAEAALDAIKPQTVNLVKGSLDTGFELIDQGLVVLTLGDIAGRRPRPARAPKQPGMTPGDIQSLQPGEYVVHANHGIGQFMGVVTREIAGAKRDYLYIRYAGQDKLYLPTDQVNHLQRYVGGGEEKAPKLHALGGSEWQRTRKKVKESVQKLAFDLLGLYAQRQRARGHAFAPDSPWQRELEDSFPYQETQDQLRSINDIKGDMEAVRPMDRLLCGDVGYGKTEVALRAAMKAVMDNRQVAVLAPTTVLAQQHFRTFSERFAPFPVRVEVLSRFRSLQQQKVVVEGVNNGSVDVIIGTHRLLQKDISFPRLGLLIVDEEQRFGVGHKEQLKNLKKDVDILTMTATPIPRTLHMALLGVRDLSVINTPPEGRFPVQTYVMEYSDQLVVSAVRRELDRGGQVYLIFNRVQGIDAVAGRLQKLMPEASIGVIHGQMADGRMEQVMLDFYEGKYDILLSTTIVENGLDIPNVNTVIVLDADRLGLSQLYQLRGRVGRGRRLANAYFTYRRDKALSEKALKRLAAIKEFTELGAGYKIALKDLEIRGAGNILGPEQHGFIAAVGFDLYCQMLEEQVKMLTGKNETVQESSLDVAIELPVSAFIPDGYLPNQEKIYVYRRIRDARQLEALEALADELKDRFGSPPPEVVNLLDIGRIRVLAAKLGVTAVTHNHSPLTRETHVRLEFSREKAPEPAQLQKLWSETKGAIDFRVTSVTTVLTRVKEDLLAETEQLLHKVSKIF